MKTYQTDFSVPDPCSHVSVFTWNSSTEVQRRQQGTSQQECSDWPRRVRKFGVPCHLSSPALTVGAVLDWAQHIWPNAAGKITRIHPASWRVLADVVEQRKQLLVEEKICSRQLSAILGEHKCSMTSVSQFSSCYFFIECISIKLTEIMLLPKKSVCFSQWLSRSAIQKSPKAAQHEVNFKIWTNRSALQNPMSLSRSTTLINTIMFHQRFC